MADFRPRETGQPLPVLDYESREELEQEWSITNLAR